jgi:hypothetical protein
MIDLPEAGQEIYRAVLAPHKISYPAVEVEIDGEVFNIKLDDVIQKNGQLMGSILSFPVLCLANLGLYLAARLGDEVNDPKLLTAKKAVKDAKRLRRLIWAALKSVLINGDDILYRATKKEYERHCQLGGEVGLEMSVGKTYFHERYANINSVSYDYDVLNDTPRIVGYFNVGLFFGQHKVMGRVGDTDEDEEMEEDVSGIPLTSVINTLLADCRKGRGSRKNVLVAYLALHKKELAKEQKGRSLFLPRYYGFPLDLASGEVLPVALTAPAVNG